MEKRIKGPRPFTEEEKIAFLTWKAEHERKMETDPEYRAKQEHDRKILLRDDSIEE